MNWRGMESKRGALTVNPLAALPGPAALALVLLLGATGVLLPLHAKALEAWQTQELSMEGVGELQVAFPGDWQLLTTGASGRRKLVFLPDEGEAFELLVDLYWREQLSPALVTLASQRALLESVAALSAETGADDGPEIQPIEPAATRGFFFRLTDEGAAKEEYSHLLQGTLDVGGALLVFTLLSRGDDPDLEAKTLRMVSDMALIRSRAPF